MKTKCNCCLCLSEENITTCPTCGLQKTYSFLSLSPEDNKVARLCRRIRMVGKISIILGVLLVFRINFSDLYNFTFLYFFHMLLATLFIALGSGLICYKKWTLSLGGIVYPTGALLSFFTGNFYIIAIYLFFTVYIYTGSRRKILSRK